MGVVALPINRKSVYTMHSVSSSSLLGSYPRGRECNSLLCNQSLYWQNGYALRLGRRQSRFDSCRPDHVGVALVSEIGCDPVCGVRFSASTQALAARWTVQRFPKPKVESSILSRGSVSIVTVFSRRL